MAAVLSCPATPGKNPIVQRCAVAGVPKNAAALCTEPGGIFEPMFYIGAHGPSWRQFRCGASLLKQHNNGFAGYGSPVADWYQPHHTNRLQAGLASATFQETILGTVKAYTICASLPPITRPAHIWNTNSAMSCKPPLCLFNGAVTRAENTFTVWRARRLFAFTSGSYDLRTDRVVRCDDGCLICNDQFGTCGGCHFEFMIDQRLQGTPIDRYVPFDEVPQPPNAPFESSGTGTLTFEVTFSQLFDLEDPALISKLRADLQSAADWSIRVIFVPPSGGSAVRHIGGADVVDPPQPVPPCNQIGHSARFWFSHLFDWTVIPFDVTFTAQSSFDGQVYSEGNVVRNDIWTPPFDVNCDNLPGGCVHMGCILYGGPPDNEPRNYPFARFYPFVT